MKGSNIVLAAEPRGRFKEGYISGTGLLPGMCVSTTATPMRSGRFTYAAAAADAPDITVLREDSLQGFNAQGPYQDGNRCLAYTPAAGEEMNMMCASGFTPTIGALLSVGAGGTLVAATGTAQFKCMEAGAALTANALVFCETLGAVG